MYLDDGIGFGQTFESVLSMFKSFQFDLRSSGFVFNERKSMWFRLVGYSNDTVRFVL